MKVVGDIEELFEKEKKAHPNARFLDGALLRDRDMEVNYAVVLVAIHHEDPATIEIRLVTPNSSFVMETFGARPIITGEADQIEDPVYGENVGLGGPLDDPRR